MPEGGIDLQLIRSRRRTVSIEIRGGGVIVRAPLRMRKAEIDRFVLSHRDWIRKKLADREQRIAAAGEVAPLTDEELKALTREAAEYIPGRVEHYAPLVGVHYGRVTIRHQRTRWGSCSSKGNLNFNCLLMDAPEEVLDYVVVHELCHIRHKNHSRAFYAMIESIMPDYKQREKELKGYDFSEVK